MIGFRCLRYYSVFLFQIPSGLTIYESNFKIFDGGRGVVGGPHEEFVLMEQQFYQQVLSSFLCEQAKLYYSGYQVNPDLRLLRYIEPMILDLYDVYQKSEAQEAHLLRSAELFYHTK